MPTIASSNIPTPKSWEEFEDITLAAAKLRWDSSDFYRNGRPGQKQDGVDIWGHDDDGRHIGVQCKNTVGGVSLTTVKAEIVNAEAFAPKLDRLYIATTAKRDATLQKDIRDISKQRGKAALFRVDILFWDDVSLDLTKDIDIFFRHYPQLRLGSDGVKEHDRKLFDQLTSLISTDGVIGFIRRHHMDWLFENSELDPFQEFLERWNAPERQFITPEIEAIRQALWSKVSSYMGAVARETFPASTPGWSSVPAGWEQEQPDRFRRALDSLHSLADEIIKLHTDLVKTGQRHLIGTTIRS